MSRDRFLEASVALFEETGEHPTVNLVQRELVGWHDETSARREAERLPPSLGDVDGDRVRPGVRAILRAEPGSALLDLFYDGLRVAVVLYRRRDRKAAAAISIAELMKRAGMSEFEAGQAIRTLSTEGLAKKVGKGKWEVMPAVRHYRSARGVEDYLIRKRKFERRQCRRRTFSRPVDFVRDLLGREGIVRAAVVSALAALLVSFAILVGSFLLGGSEEAKPGHRESRATKQRPGS